MDLVIKFKPTPRKRRLKEGSLVEVNTDTTPTVRYSAIWVDWNRLVVGVFNMTRAWCAVGPSNSNTRINEFKDGITFYQVDRILVGWDCWPVCYDYWRIYRSLCRGVIRNYGEEEGAKYTRAIRAIL